MEDLDSEKPMKSNQIIKGDVIKNGSKNKMLSFD